MTRARIVTGEALAFVRREQVILGCMVLDMLAVIFGGAAGNLDDEA